MLSRINGKNLEELCIFRMKRERNRGLAIMNRSGVHCSQRFDSATQTMVYQPLSSPPDFEGVTAPDGRQFIFDAKVCSAASLSIDSQGGSGRGKREIPYLLERSTFGVATFLLIHFTPRELKASTVPARTVAFPVHVHHPFWEEYERGSVKRINWTHCDEYGLDVEWNAHAGGRKETPDIYSAVMWIRGCLDDFNHRTLERTYRSHATT
jgi:hypothetical protein